VNTLLVKRFDYTNLERTNRNGKRHYKIKGDKEANAVVSVTTILSGTKDQRDIDALAQWRRNIGHARANEITHEAASRGTRMHKYLETYCNTGIFPSPGSNPYAQHANGMSAGIAQYGFMLVNEIWGTEINLYFPEIYGGATDCVGVHDGDEAILDFKQTNKLKRKSWITDYFIQLSAYGEAHNEVYGTNINKGVIMMSSRNWEYQEFIIKGKEYDKYRKMWWTKVEQYYKSL